MSKLRKTRYLLDNRSDADIARMLEYCSGLSSCSRCELHHLGYDCDSILMHEAALRLYRASRVEPSHNDDVVDVTGTIIEGD